MNFEPFEMNPQWVSESIYYMPAVVRNDAAARIYQLELLAAIEKAKLNERMMTRQIELKKYYDQAMYELEWKCWNDEERALKKEINERILKECLQGIDKRWRRGERIIEGRLNIKKLEIEYELIMNDRRMRGEISESDFNEGMRKNNIEFELKTNEDEMKTKEDELKTNRNYLKTNEDDLKMIDDNGGGASTPISHTRIQLPSESTRSIPNTPEEYDGESVDIRDADFGNFCEALSPGEAWMRSTEASLRPNDALLSPSEKWL